MKTYKYSTKERAERVSKTLGCSGSHYHNEDGKKKFMPCKDMKTFKEKTKKESKGKEEEVNELIDDDGTWLSSSIPILDPASSMKGSTFTDKTVQQARNPRDPLLRGWYGYYGEGKLAEENMEDAFGYHDTMFMDYDETVEYFQKKLKLDKDSAIERTIQQGKKPKLHKKTPKKISNKKNFIDRLILKEKGVDDTDELIEDILLSKKEKTLSDDSAIMNTIKRNIMSLKKMAEKEGISTKQLIDLLGSE
jgi:hypothetical protein